MMYLSDEQIVLKVFGDKEVYSELVDRYVEKLGRYVYYLIGVEDEVSDVVQSSFIKAYVNLRSFDTRKKFSTWIYRIAHNEAVNYIRRKKVLNFGDGGFDFVSATELEGDLEKKELVEAVDHCLEQLPLKYRMVLSLHFLEEKSYEEISDILRIPMGTVATNISRGKKIMKSICNQK